MVSYRSLATVALLFLLLGGCKKSPEQARKEIGDLGISYTQEGFQQSVSNKDPVAVDLFLIAGMNPSPFLGEVVLGGNIKTVKKFLAYRADPNYRSGVPLFFAASKGYNEIITLLIQKGADPNLIANPFGFGASSPLEEAASQGYLETVKLLLDKGAKANDRANNNSAALVTAVRKNHIEIVRLLLERGANPNSSTGFFSVGELVRNKPEIKRLLQKNNF